MFYTDPDGSGTLLFLTGLFSLLPCLEILSNLALGVMVSPVERFYIQAGSADIAGIANHAPEVLSQGHKIGTSRYLHPQMIFKSWVP